MIRIGDRSERFKNLTIILSLAQNFTQTQTHHSYRNKLVICFLLEDDDE